MKQEVRVWKQSLRHVSQDRVPNCTTLYSYEFIAVPNSDAVAHKGVALNVIPLKCSGAFV
jgi:hypothetical protein